MGAYVVCSRCNGRCFVHIGKLSRQLFDRKVSIQHIVHSRTRSSEASERKAACPQLKSCSWPLQLPAPLAFSYLSPTPPGPSSYDNAVRLPPTTPAESVDSPSCTPSK